MIQYAAQQYRTHKHKFLQTDKAKEVQYVCARACARAASSKGRVMQTSFLLLLQLLAGNAGAGQMTDNLHYSHC